MIKVNIFDDVFKDLESINAWKDPDEFVCKNLSPVKRPIENPKMIKNNIQKSLRQNHVNVNQESPINFRCNDLMLTLVLFLNEFGMIK